MAEEADPDQLRKLRRRHKRDLRYARAEGMLQGVLSMLRPGDVVVDCGANQGDVTGPLAETGAIVHAFEPDPYNVAKLTERFSGMANVHVHAAAVGAAEGSVRLMRAANWDANPDLASVKSTIVPGGHNIGDGGIEVPLIDFPGFLRGLIAAHGRVAFVKMDIEGAELDLLAAMHGQGLFDAIQLTVAETHERKFKELRPRFAALRDTIAASYPATRVNLDWI
jgi:FkbM family methyltransferase